MIAVRLRFRGDVINDISWDVLCFFTNPPTMARTVAETSSSILSEGLCAYWASSQKLAPEKQEKVGNSFVCA